jgi:hypothetical protein
MKQDCNRLKIVKNKKTTDANGMFNYVFEWYQDNKMLYQEIHKIDADIYNTPIENYNIEDMIEHKQYCCLNIDPINIKIEETEL